MRYLLLFFFCAFVSAQNIYYVDYEGGNDSNAGTINAPWKNASKISSGSTTNDTVRLKGNVTLVPDAQLVLDSGQTLESYGEGIATIQVSTANKHCVQLDTTTGVTIQKINLRHIIGSDPGAYSCVQVSTSVNNLTLYGVGFFGGFAGFNCGSDSGTGNLIYGCFFERQWTDGIDVRGTLNLLINNCTFWNVGNDGGAAAVGGAGDAISSHDQGTFTATECRFYSGHRGPGQHVHTSGTCTYTRCFVEVDSATLTGTGIFGMNAAGRLDVNNCVIIHTGTTARYAFLCGTGGTLNAYNNTYVSNSTSSGRIVFLCSSGTLTAINNLIHLGATFGTHTQKNSGATFTSNYNSYYPSTGNRWIIDGTAGTFATWQGSGRDANGITTDPLLYNATTPSTVSDVRLTTSSPCRSAGTADSGIGVDIRNRTRVTMEVGAWSKER